MADDDLQSHTVIPRTHRKFTQNWANDASTTVDDDLRCLSGTHARLTHAIYTDTTHAILPQNTYWLRMPFNIYLSVTTEGKKYFKQSLPKAPKICISVLRELFWGCGSEWVLASLLGL